MLFLLFVFVFFMFFLFILFFANQVCLRSLKMKLGEKLQRTLALATFTVVYW